MACLSMYLSLSPARPPPSHGDLEICRMVPCAVPAWTGCFLQQAAGDRQQTHFNDSALLLKSTGSQRWTHLQAQKRSSSNVYSAFGRSHLFSDSPRVFESSEEAGALVLTIVVSGHFFISQGQTLLEGFSLVGSKSWLKIVRRMDCLLFGTTIKSKSRMFRVQFSGESQEEALQRCCSCVQTLAQYVTVQAPDSPVQQLQQSPGPLEAGESQGKDPLQQGPYLNLEQQVCVAAGAGALEGKTSVMHLAQTILASEKLPQVYEQSSWGAEELGPFLRLCLMDQNFPAFVEEVEKELRKITQS